MKILFFLLLCPSLLFCKEIHTFYGPIDVHEDVLLELIESPSFQRLKGVHQYGIAYYTTHKEEYTRYDHSLGVFAILRSKGGSLEEQIAGLLHDVSHTAFSHVGDWIFGKVNQEKDYQNSIHLEFLEKSELGNILRKYRIEPYQILPTHENYPRLECSLPYLCADRMDYNLQGAFYQHFLTKEEALALFNDLEYREGRWVSSLSKLMRKLTEFSFFMTEDCWGSPTNYMLSRWLADAILRGMELGRISDEALHHGTDDVIWEYLHTENDPYIRERMEWIEHPEDFFEIVEHEYADNIVKMKFRGIDPWIQREGNIFQISDLFPDLRIKMNMLQEKFRRGWGVKYIQRIQFATQLK